MKPSNVRSFVGIVFVASLASALMAQQHPPKPIGPSSYLESWQGQPGKPDKIDHIPVGAGTIMACIDVQPRQAGSECKLRYENGGEETLKFRDSITATKTDVIYLTCNATVAQRSCKVQLNSPKQ